MKVFFKEKDRAKILSSIQGAMGGRELAKMVTFNMVAGGLEVVISKFGTSTLKFSEKALEQGIEYNLASEKIALTHRALRDEVTNKIVRVIEKAGGTVS